jgi:hypothetical protein
MIIEYTIKRRVLIPKIYLHILSIKVKKIIRNRHFLFKKLSLLLQIAIFLPSSPCLVEQVIREEL